MDPELYYKNRLTSLHTTLTKLLKKQTTFGYLRFAAAAALIFGIYLCWGTGLIYILLTALIITTIFVSIIMVDTDNKSIIRHTNQLISINEDELLALADNHAHFQNGNQFISRDHYYANDLDIFGKGSLYQFLNRTTSDSGSRTLAEWLTRPTDAEHVLSRQTAIKELVKHSEWKQEFQATGRDKRILDHTLVNILEWLESPDQFLGNKTSQMIKYLLPVIMGTITILFIADVFGWLVFSIALILFGAFAERTGKKINPIQDLLSKIVDEMEVLSASIKLIENESFHSPLLKLVQHQFIQENSPASKEIRKLKNILERLDIRKNKMLAPVFEIYLCWGIHQVTALEKWKQLHKDKVALWFAVIGQVEALNSISTIAFNHPTWAFPTLDNDHFCLEGRSLGHPLIPNNKRIDNDIKMDHRGDLMLVTGSNMAGKSTYLRTIGVNVVLAMAGAPVCGAAFRLSPLQIISSMRISDNLEESTSTFYAELKKLKTIIELINNNEPAFILLDEILRGTNSLDRHTGSVALIRQLIKKEAVGIIATHDLELATMKETYPGNIFNYHFDVQVSNEELFFDYKLKEGVCTSMNASILMQKIGIEL